MKKIKLFGSLTTLGVVALPIVSTVAFASNTTESKALNVFGVDYTPKTTPTDYTSPKYNTSGDIRTYAYASSLTKVTIQPAAVEAANSILTMMSNDSDYMWRPVGIPMIDGFNMIRYAIKQSAMNYLDPNKGTQLAKTRLNEFVANSYPELRNFQPTGTWRDQAAAQINDWLQGVKKFPEIDHNTANDELTSLTNLAKSKSYRLNTVFMSNAQYRTNQVEWLGASNGHDATTTTSDMIANPDAKGNILAPNIVAATAWTNNATGNSITSSENIMWALDVSPQSDPRARLNDATQTNVYSAADMALRVLYDTNGEGATTGHRFSGFNYRQDVMGYSKALVGLGSSVWPMIYYKNYHWLPESYGISGITNDEDYKTLVLNSSNFNAYTTKYVKTPFDYTKNSVATKEFDLLGNETFMTHLAGAEDTKVITDKILGEQV